jgi:hypothetical protein
MCFSWVFVLAENLQPLLFNYQKIRHTINFNKMTKMHVFVRGLDMNISCISCLSVRNSTKRYKPTQIDEHNINKVKKVKKNRCRAWAGWGRVRRTSACGRPGSGAGEEKTWAQQALMMLNMWCGRWRSSPATRGKGGSGGDGRRSEWLYKKREVKHRMANKR